MLASLSVRMALSLAVASFLTAALPAQQTPAGSQPTSSTSQTTSASPDAPAPDSQTPAASSGAKISAQELANQVNNPSAPLTYIQSRDILLPSVDGQKGPISALQLQPVVPVGPFHAFPFVQLVKVTVPFLVSTPGIAPPITCPVCGNGTTGVTGMGDLQVFDLVTVKQSWGRWGFGPALVFPTATETQLGAGKYQAGPAFALIYSGIKNLTAGFVIQNPISYAGAPHRANVNQMIIAPTFTYSLNEGWFLGMSDFNLTWNWENGNAATVPLGVQVGKVVRIGKQPFSISVEAGGAAVRPPGSPNPGVIFGFELSPIFNIHIGPHQKIKVRGKP